MCDGLYYIHPHGLSAGVPCGGIWPFGDLTTRISWPLGKSEQDRVLGALAPLLDQVGASDVPSSAEGFRQKFGLDIEIKRKLTRIDYCDQHKNCGFMQFILHLRTGRTRLPRCANTARR